MRLRWWVPGVGAVLVAACVDRSSPVVSVGPEAETRAVAPDGYEAPSYASASSVPPEYLWAEVRSHTEVVSWSGNTASGYGRMEYFGNRGRIELEMQVLHRYSTVGTARTQREKADIIPAVRYLGIPLPYTVPESCGQIANLYARYSARTILFVETRITEIGPEVEDGHAEASQPSCPPPDGPCSSPGEPMTSISAAPGANASPDGFLYDPYDPGYGTTSDCPESGGGGGGSGGGSEQTFPEMCSSLGGKLYYDYGCMEVYNADTGNWETVWCGTFSVCET